MNFKRFIFIVLTLLWVHLNLNIFAQNNGDISNGNDWKPTGMWPYVNRKFMPATIVTGIFNKKTIYPCNIHIGKHTLVYVMNDTLMEADPINIKYVEFKNGDKYQSIGNVFAKIVHEDSIGKILLVKTVDKSQLRQNYNDISSMGSLTIEGYFGELSLDLMPAYIHNPEEEPLPIVNTFFFNYNLEIFEVTNKNILKHINQQRKREYKVFTRNEEILTHNLSSVMKIWESFFVNY